MKTCLIHSSVLSASSVLIFTVMMSACQKRAEDVGSASSSGVTSSGATASGHTESSDTMITAKVKAALLNNRQIKAMDIHVETSKGEVVLSGQAESKEQIDQAIQIAQGIDGVKKVTNKLIVKKS